MGNRKLILRMIVDLLMTVCLLGLMSFMLTGQQYHEWIGAAALVLFIIHHILNLSWIRQSGRGRYTPYRVLQSLLVILVFLAILGCMVSGIVMSQYVFAFLPIQGGMSLARLAHMVCVYWSFILMSLHLGLHWNMILGVVRKAAGTTAPSHLRTLILRLMAAAVAAYGIYAFLKHRLVDYLFLRTMFVFFDNEQPPLQFLAEYLAMMGLWIFLAHYGSRLLKRKRAVRQKPYQSTNTGGELMKRLATFFLAAILLLLSSCSTGPERSSGGAAPSVSVSQEAAGSTESMERTPPSQQDTEEREEQQNMDGKRTIRIVMDSGEILVELDDHPGAQALYDLLPLELSFEDYNSTEKIAYLDDELATDGSPDNCDPEVGDLCYYIPWGNLCLFYQDFRHSESLVPLGTVISGAEMLEQLDTESTVTVESAD